MTYFEHKQRFGPYFNERTEALALCVDLWEPERLHEIDRVLVADELTFLEFGHYLVTIIEAAPEEDRPILVKYVLAFHNFLTPDMVEGVLERTFEDPTRSQQDVDQLDRTCGNEVVEAVQQILRTNPTLEALGITIYDCVWCWREPMYRWHALSVALVAMGMTPYHREVPDAAAAKRLEGAYTYLQQQYPAAMNELRGLLKAGTNYNSLPGLGPRLRTLLREIPADEHNLVWDLVLSTVFHLGAQKAEGGPQNPMLRGFASPSFVST